MEYLDPYIGTFRKGERGAIFQVLGTAYENNVPPVSYRCQYVDRWANKLWLGKEFRLGCIPMQETTPYPKCVECEERPTLPEDYLCRRCRDALRLDLESHSV